MVQLIDKSALVAEIESKIEKYTKRGEESDAKRDGYGMYWGGVLSCLNEVRTLCDTLEVKEVDLKENHELTWEDVAWITNKAILKCKEESTLTAEDICKDVLKQFKAQKEELVMAQYIDKSAVAAEIERRIKGLKDCHADTVAGYAGEISGLERLLSFINTLKVEEIWKPADGDDLPEIDRVVIALIPAYDGWKVVFAHRPDPVGCWGKSILSDEYEHFQPKTYDGWNIPNIKWWLDLDFPKIDE